jgi:hypothetical protein
MIRGGDDMDAGPRVTLPDGRVVVQGQKPASGAAQQPKTSYFRAVRASCQLSLPLRRSHAKTNACHCGRRGRNTGGQLHSEPLVLHGVALTAFFRSHRQTFSCTSQTPPVITLLWFSDRPACNNFNRPSTGGYGGAARPRTGAVGAIPLLLFE